MSQTTKPSAADVLVCASVLEAATELARARGLYVGSGTISEVPLAVLDELAGPHYETYVSPRVTTAPRFHLFRSHLNGLPRIVGRRGGVMLRADRDDELGELEARLRAHEAEAAP